VASRRSSYDHSRLRISKDRSAGEYVLSVESDDGTVMQLVRVKGLNELRNVERRLAELSMRGKPTLRQAVNTVKKMPGVRV